MGKARPNILLFTTDQHRGDHLSIAGHPVVETPNVDSFVQQGAYFPNAYTEIPSTTGARRVMLSGQGNYTCGLVGYADYGEPALLEPALRPPERALRHDRNLGSHIAQTARIADGSCA